jgi:hypothetical protein
LKRNPPVAIGDDGTIGDYILSIDEVELIVDTHQDLDDADVLLAGTQGDGALFDINGVVLNLSTVNTGDYQDLTNQF